MKNILFSALYFSVLLAFGFSSGVAQKAPDPEKLALIREFLAMTEATKGAAETSDLMLGLQAA